MKKKRFYGALLILMLTLCMALALVGCNNNSNNNNNGNNQQNQNQNQQQPDPGTVPKTDPPGNVGVDPKTVEGVPEMHDVKWDMTAEQVSRLAGKGETKSDGNIYARKSIFGYDADVCSVMQGGKLARVEYTIALENSAEASDACASINRLVSHEYGESDAKANTDPKYLYYDSWSLGKTTIALYRLSDGLIHIDYAKT